MRVFLSILCICISLSVNSQTRSHIRKDSPPLLDIKPERKIVIPPTIVVSAKDSIHTPVIHETIYRGKKIRIVTEYVKP